MESDLTYSILPGPSRHGNSIEVEFQVRAQRHSIFFRSSDISLSANLEAFLASILLPCMSTGGGTIHVSGESSHHFLSTLPTIQDIYCSWYPSFRRVELEGVSPITRQVSTEKRVGAFFSGGVDSFYTLLKNRDEITDLIFLHGLDVRLDNRALREKISKNIREVALAFNKNVIEIETNIRELLDPYKRFGNWGHGIGLAIAGSLLYPAFQRIFIPASYTYAFLIPNGIHPILDPLWSTEALQFVHHGCESSRVGKVALIAQHEIALSHLRVCHSNEKGVYNCGRCEKCIRTMINLKLNGALQRCTAFNNDLRMRDILTMDYHKETTRFFLQENLDALRRRGEDREIAWALQRVLNRPPWLRKLRKRIKGYRRGLARRFPGIFG